MSPLWIFVPIAFGVIVSVLIANFLLKKKTDLTKSMLKGNKLLWMLKGYVVILLLSIVVFYILPVDRTSYGKVMTDQEKNQAMKDGNSFVNRVNNGKIDEANGAILKKQWEFTLQGDKLILPDDWNMLVMAERTEKNDHQIKIEHYVTPSIIEDTEVTKKMPSPTVHLDQDRLLIGNGKLVEIKLAYFKNSFISNQFNAQPLIKMDHQSIFGNNLLYLRIPKGIEVEGNVQFVKKD